MHFLKTRRQILVGACASAVAALARPAAAQGAYPSRPIRLIVGFPPGGITDVIFRTAGAEVSKRIGQPVVIENKPGGAGVSAYLAIKSASPDGYTIGGVNSALWRQPVLEDVDYDPLKDFTYIANIAETIFTVVVAADSPFKSWSDLLAYGRANPQKVAFGASPGLRQSAHIFMLEVMKREKLDWQAIGYSGGSKGLSDVLGGHLTFTVEPVISASDLARGGKVRFLALASDRRMKGWPDVPTMKELGYDISIDSPIGVGGPAGLPVPIVQTLQDAFKFALEQPSMVSLFDRTDQNARYMSAAELKDYVIRSEVEQRELLTRYGFAKKP